MLTPGDDYPLHQTPEPIAFAGTDRNFYDRYFFNGMSLDGSFFFAVAFGIYPQLDIMDGAFSVLVDGKQHILRVSKRMSVESILHEQFGVSVNLVRAGCDKAEGAGDQEGGQVGTCFLTDKASAKGGDGCAKLVPGQNPAEHDSRVFFAKGLVGQFGRGRDGGDPVKAIEDRENRQAGRTEAEERQGHQR